MRLIRQTGVHACATIMGSAPITDTSPLLERTDGTVTTTFEYHTCETLGLVKMDFLGLSNLTVIRDTLTNIEHNGKGVIDYTKIPLDDRETYQLLVARRHARRVPARFRRHALAAQDAQAR